MDSRFFLRFKEGIREKTLSWKSLHVLKFQTTDYNPDDSDEVPHWHSTDCNIAKLCRPLQTYSSFSSTLG